jgi:hypothetical protein
MTFKSITNSMKELTEKSKGIEKDVHGNITRRDCAGGHEEFHFDYDEEEVHYQRYRKGELEIEYWCSLDNYEDGELDKLIKQDHHVEHVSSWDSADMMIGLTSMDKGISKGDKSYLTVVKNRQGGGKSMLAQHQLMKFNQQQMKNLAKNVGYKHPALDA